MSKAALITCGLIALAAVPSSASAEAPRENLHAVILEAAKDHATRRQMIAAAPKRMRIVRSTEPMFDPLLDKEFVSLRLAKTVWVRAEPKADGALLGMISRATRPEYVSHSTNDDCPTPWVEIKPMGWICIRVFPSSKPVTVKSKKPPKPLLGNYAIIRGAGRLYKTLELATEKGDSRLVKGDIVRLTRSVKTEDGRKLWRTQRGEWVEDAHVGKLSGSRFSGVKLDQPDGLRLPLAFAVNRDTNRARGAVKVFAEPKAGVRAKRSLKSKTVVSLGKRSPDGMFFSIGDSIGDDEWVRFADLRIAQRVPKPASAADGVWVDVDIDEQVIVVYRGDTPILATLGSSGREKDPTPTGVFRVTRKKRQTTMANERHEAQSYSVAVPWPTYFYEGYAFHSAYWHNSFGKARSHGCINLAPNDALAIHQVLGPELPPGWLAVYSDDDVLPGSVVQIRGRVEVPPPTKPGAGGLASGP